MSRPPATQPARSPAPSPRQPHRPRQHLSGRAGRAGPAPPSPAWCLRKYGLACYSPAQIRRAYDLAPLYARGLDGRGRTIVIVNSFGSPTIRHDLRVFDTAFGLPGRRRSGCCSPSAGCRATTRGTRTWWTRPVRRPPMEAAHALVKGRAIAFMERRKARVAAAELQAGPQQAMR